MSTQQPEHPNPKIWWRVIKWQSNLSLAAIILQAPMIIALGLPDGTTAPLVVVNLGLVSIAASYSGGSVLIDAIRAWRGTG